MLNKVQIPDKTVPMIIWCGPTDGIIIRQINFEHMFNIVIKIVPAQSYVQGHLQVHWKSNSRPA